MPTAEWRNRWTHLGSQLATLLELPRGCRNPWENPGVRVFTQQVWPLLKEDEKALLTSDDPAKALARFDVMEIKNMWRALLQSSCTASSTGSGSAILPPPEIAPVQQPSVPLKSKHVLERMKEAFAVSCKKEIQALQVNWPTNPLKLQAAQALLDHLL